MSDVVIRAEGLGKKYVIGHQAERERYTALRDVMARAAKNAWRRTAGLARGLNGGSGTDSAWEEFWALKEVSFEVKRGEVLGIIGRNGAGKSTLLKILSRITEPSEGRVEIRGRVASLLEVGTGFHPELTGRENIYLNGAILGMTRAEIRKKFDEIVAFAEVEKFLDTPVKRYSSGMYVRLAFAVAAHLEPEILVIDEVLAVGDTEFQKKCLGKMQDIAWQGRTVLFVSHSLHTISTLCTVGLVLQRGRIIAQDSVNECVQLYKRNITQPASSSHIFQSTINVLSQNYPNEQLSFWIPKTAVGADAGELRVFLRSADGESVAFASQGGFASRPIKILDGVLGLDVTLDATGLAEGLYQFTVEFVTADFGNITFCAESDIFDFRPMTRVGEFGNLRRSDRVGFFRIGMTIKGIKDRSQEKADAFVVDEN